MRLRALLFATLAIGTACTAFADDWPQWRGPNRDGKSAEKGLLQDWPKSGPKLTWKVNLGGYGYASPSVVGDKIFLTVAEDHEKGLKEFAVCLNAKDGSQVWKSKTLPASENRYKDYSRGNGPRSSVTVLGDLLYTPGSHGDLSCLKASDGSVVWTHSFANDFGGGIPTWGYSESVLIDGDKLLCTPGGNKGSIVALNPKTGEKIWQSADLKDAAGYSSIIVAEIGNVKQYITQTDKAGVGVRASDGKLLWRVDQLLRRTAVIPTPVINDGYVFFTAGYGAGCECFKLEPDGDGTKATVVYTKNNRMSNHHGGVINLGNFVYGHTNSGEKWACFDFTKASPDTASEFKFGKGSVTYADGRFYLYSEDKGEVVLVEANPEAWTEKGRFTIPEESKPRRGGKIWAHPVISNGKLYLRDHEHFFCYDIRKPGA